MGWGERAAAAGPAVGDLGNWTGWEPVVVGLTDRVYNPDRPVKPPPSGSGLSDRFDQKPVETG